MYNLSSCIWEKLRATSHTSQRPSMTMKWWGPLTIIQRMYYGYWKAILCSDGPSNIVWSENGPCWGTIAYIIGGKRRADLPHQLHVFILFLFFHSLFEFYIGEEGTESMMDHLERRGRLHWLYIGVGTWLYNLCLICHHWHSIKFGKLPWFWAFVFRVWTWAIVVCGHLIEI